MEEYLAHRSLLMSENLVCPFEPRRWWSQVNRGTVYLGTSTVRYLQNMHKLLHVSCGHNRNSNPLETVAGELSRLSYSYIPVGDEVHGVNVRL